MKTVNAELAGAGDGRSGTVLSRASGVPFASLAMKGVSFAGLMSATSLPPGAIGVRPS